MTYPQVKRAHIVPRFYLDRFAVRSKIVIHVVEADRAETVSINDAAVRTTFYRRTRPDGTQIDDVEWSLSQLEGAVAPILGQIEDLWPLDPETTKANLAEFFAFQAVRGPRWRQWHDDFARQAVEQKRQERAHRMSSGLWVALGQDQIDEFEAHVTSETERLIRMMSLANKLICVFGSMTWDLVKFDQPLLALSDHPVVEWPLDATRRRPGVATGHGAGNLLEVRVPVAPDLAIVMSWPDEKDSLNVINATTEEAANLNAFTIAHAEKQWMEQPGSSPPTSDGPFEPLSLLLRPGYERGRAERSRARRQVVELVNRKLGEFSTEAQIVTVQ